MLDHIRIPEEQWAKHDLKKLVGLLLLLLLALIFWLTTPKTLPLSGEMKPFSINSPTLWPKVIARNEAFEINGTSGADNLELLADGIMVDKHKMEAGSNLFTLKAISDKIVGKKLEIKEYFSDSSMNKSHSLENLSYQAEGEAYKGNFTLDTHKSMQKMKLGMSEFGGEAPVGQTVYLYIDKYVCGKATAGADNRWKISRFVNMSKVQRDIRAKNATTGEYTPSAMVDVLPEGE